MDDAKRHQSARNGSPRRARIDPILSTKDYTARAMTKGPDFSQPPLAAAPPAAFAPAPRDGVLPEGFFSTTNLPTYVRLQDGWVLAARPRMDSVLVARG